MKIPSEKEKLLSMLTEVYNQLEELDSVLEASFSDLRKSLEKKILDRVTVPKQRIDVAEKGIDQSSSFSIKETDSSLQHLSRGLKLELGF